MTLLLSAFLRLAEKIYSKSPCDFSKMNKKLENRSDRKIIKTICLMYLIQLNEINLQIIKLINLRENL